MLRYSGEPKTVVLVTASRDWADREAVWAALDELRPDLVLVGDCPTGGDAHTVRWCEVHGVKYVVFKANWKLYGKSAGPLRNGEMVHRLKLHRGGGDRCHALAFPEPHRRGTQNCMRRLKAAGFDVDNRGAA